jgi:hypothetical protein
VEGGPNLYVFCTLDKTVRQLLQMKKPHDFITRLFPSHNDEHFQSVTLELILPVTKIHRPESSYTDRLCEIVGTQNVYVEV